MKFIKNLISRLFPVATISTCFGIGFFPDWQRHWAAFFAICASGVLVYFLEVFRFTDLDPLMMAIPLTLFAILSFVVGVPSVFLYRCRRSDIEDKLVIDVFVGQILVIALAIPAVIEISFVGMLCVDFFCKGTWNCVHWFYSTMHAVYIFFIPYAVFRFFDIINFWPGSRFVLVHNSVWANMFVGISGAFYSIFTLYAVAFVLLDLNLLDTMQFFRDLCVGVMSGLNAWYRCGIEALNYLTNDFLFDMINLLGLREMLENNGILEKLGVGVVETPGVEIENIDEIVKSLDDPAN